jgi:nicotinamide-nucleotide amidase
MQPIAGRIYQLLGNLIFGEGDDELQHAVTRLLAAQEKTLATAECGTAGKIAAWMSAIGGSSYRGGIVTSTETTDDVAADCESLASGGAIACRQQFAADFGLAVGPLAPSGSSEPKQIQFALATGKTVIHETATAAGHPALSAERTAKVALNILRRHLLGSE